VTAGAWARQERAAWLFTAPAIVLIALFFLLPVGAGLLLSLTDADIYAIGSPESARFVGFENYARLLADPVFWKAFANTFAFVLLGVPLSVLVSLAAALLLHSRLTRLASFFRTVYFLPVVTTLVAVAIVWRYLYHPRYGLLNFGLDALGLGPVDWLGDPRLAVPAIVLLTVWKNFGYNMLIFLAGLQTIPEELYEAAQLDGAGFLARFRHVTLPGLVPTFLFVGVTTVVGTFQIFAEPYVMTQGGPLKATTTIVLLLYEEGFRWWRIGAAAAISFLLLLVMLAATLLQLRLARGRG
jgi:multiple sugar transport system permease protein